MPNMLTIINHSKDIYCKKTWNSIFCKNIQTKLPIIYSRIFVIEESKDTEKNSCYLYEYDINYKFLGDSWYASLEAALDHSQALFYEIEYNWVTIPACFGDEIDPIDYSKKLLYIDEKERDDTLKDMIK